MASEKTTSTEKEQITDAATIREMFNSAVLAELLAVLSYNRNHRSTKHLDIFDGPIPIEARSDGKRLADYDIVPMRYVKMGDGTDVPTGVARLTARGRLAVRMVTLDEDKLERSGAIVPILNDVTT